VPIRKIKNWLEKGYIPGAIKNNANGQWVLPTSARCPYTQARARKAESINFSIVKAATKRQHIFAELYHISTAEFQNYIEKLINDGYLIACEADGIIYYNATMSGEELVQQKHMNVKKTLGNIVATGGPIVAALIS